MAPTAAASSRRDRKDTNNKLNKSSYALGNSRENNVLYLFERGVQRATPKLDAELEEIVLVHNKTKTNWNLAKIIWIYKRIGSEVISAAIKTTIKLKLITRQIIKLYQLEV